MTAELAHQSPSRSTGEAFHEADGEDLGEHRDEESVARSPEEQAAFDEAAARYKQLLAASSAVAANVPLDDMGDGGPEVSAPARPQRSPPLPPSTKPADSALTETLLLDPSDPGEDHTLSLQVALAKGCALLARDEKLEPVATSFSSELESLYLEKEALQKENEALQAMLDQVMGMYHAERAKNESKPLDEKLRLARSSAAKGAAKGWNKFEGALFGDDRKLVTELPLPKQGIGTSAPKAPSEQTDELLVRQ